MFVCEGGGSWMNRGKDTYASLALVPHFTLGPFGTKERSSMRARMWLRSRAQGQPLGPHRSH